jgi:DNA-binding IclR family transcriptional regulator
VDTKKTKSVPALERALKILEMLAISRTGLTLAEIARHLGLARSSTHYLLLTLERSGYLYRNKQTSRYMFGVKLFTLAHTHQGRASAPQRKHHRFTEETKGAFRARAEARLCH